MEACRKKPAQPASGTLSWMTPSETLLRLCLGGFGNMKWAWGGGWRLPAFLCQTTSSPGFCPISRAHFRDRKTLRKRVHHKGPPLLPGSDLFQVFGALRRANCADVKEMPSSSRFSKLVAAENEEMSLSSLATAEAGGWRFFSAVSNKSFYTVRNCCHTCNRGETPDGCSGEDSNQHKFPIPDGRK